MPLTGLSTTSEEDFVLGNTDLEKIVALLIFITQAFLSKMHVDDIHVAALETLLKSIDVPTGGTLALLHTESTLIFKTFEAR